MNPLQRLSQLRRLMHSIEVDLGIKEFSVCEKDIIAVFTDHGSKQFFTTADISNDAMMKGHSRPTVFRALASLIDRGLIERVGQAKSGVYRILDVSNL